MMDIVSGNSIIQFRGPYRFLSNFYPHVQVIRGVSYPTNEHWYQASKTTIASERKYIIDAYSPGEAKRRGRQVTIRPDWKMVDLSYMLMGLRVKYSDPVLAEKLIRTNDMELIEGNYWGDKYWGVCLKTNCGLNMLGKLSMLVRDNL